MLFLALLLRNLFKEVSFIGEHESILEGVGYLLDAVRLFDDFGVDKFLQGCGLELGESIQLHQALVEVAQSRHESRQFPLLQHELRLLLAVLRQGQVQLRLELFVTDFGVDASLHLESIVFILKLDNFVSGHFYLLLQLFSLLRQFLLVLVLLGNGLLVLINLLLKSLYLGHQVAHFVLKQLAKLFVEFLLVFYLPFEILHLK